MPVPSNAGAFEVAARIRGEKNPWKGAGGRTPRRYTNLPRLSSLRVWAFPDTRKCGSVWVGAGAVLRAGRIPVMSAGDGNRRPRCCDRIGPPPGAI
jgi:hypothetical protein